MYDCTDQTSVDQAIAAENEEDGLEPLRSEVEWAISGLKSGKSPGYDNVPAELIKESGNSGVLIYHLLVKKIWNTGIWPIDWKISIYIAFQKKGDLKECSNYRTIALISHASKILLCILLKRMEGKLEAEVKNTQAGFRCRRGTRDHIFNLNILLQKCLDVNTELRICFIDYSKAFDCVKHNDLWNGLLEFGFNKKTVTLIRNLYAGQEAAVRLDAELSDWFKVNKGVRQGCILSPYLFSLYTEDIMRNVEDDLTAGDFHEPKVNGVGMMSLDTQTIKLCYLSHKKDWKM